MIDQFSKNDLLYDKVSLNLFIQPPAPPSNFLVLLTWLIFNIFLLGNINEINSIISSLPGLIPAELSASSVPCTGKGSLYYKWWGFTIPYLIEVHCHRVVIFCIWSYNLGTWFVVVLAYLIHSFELFLLQFPNSLHV